MQTYFLRNAVFILWCTSHKRAAFICTNLTHSAIEDLSAVEKVDHMHSEPIIEFLILWLLNTRFQVDS